MDGPKEFHVQFSKSGKDKYHMISLISKKMVWMNLFGNQNRLTDRKQTYGYQRGYGGVGGDQLGVWD